MNTTKKEFVPHEQALALKELGFDEPCLGYWNIDPYLPNPTFNMVRPFDHIWCVPAPLYQQAFRWFREKYGLYHIIHCPAKDVAVYTITGFDIPSVHSYVELKSYEEAELACLIKLIEIVKEKKNG